MVFSSVVFLFYFLPLVLLFAFLARSTARVNAVLIVASLAFYVYGEAQHTLVLLAVVAVAHAYSHAVSAGRETVAERTALPIAVVATLGLLGYFKYAEFMRSSLAPLLPWLARLDFRDVHLPLGISFFVFHTLSYMIDIHRGVVPVQKSLSKLMLYAHASWKLISEDGSSKIWSTTVPSGLAISSFLASPRTKRWTPSCKSPTVTQRHGDRPRAHVRLPLSRKLPAIPTSRSRCAISGSAGTLRCRTGYGTTCSFR